MMRPSTDRRQKDAPASLVRRSLLLIRLVGFGPLSATHLLDLVGEGIASACVWASAAAASQATHWSALVSQREPLNHVGSTLVGRENRVENMFTTPSSMTSVKRFNSVIPLVWNVGSCIARLSAKCSSDKS